MHLGTRSTKIWINFYKRMKPRKFYKFLGYTLHRIRPNTFQQLMIREISQKISLLHQEKPIVTILSAGCGIDFIAYHLKKRFGNTINILLMDVSAECIVDNKRLFQSSMSYQVADIFSFTKKPFDIVYNTGLLEHFTLDEQGRILDVTQQVLGTHGYYITLNPFAGGKMYIKYMNLAKQKGIWEYGEEIPLVTLQHFSTASFHLIHEYPCCSLQQFSFLKYKNPIIFSLCLPAILLCRFVYTDYIDGLFGKAMGYYALVSIFEKGMWKTPSR